MQHCPFLANDGNSNLTIFLYLVNCLPDNPFVVFLGYRTGLEARFQEIPNIRSNLFLHLTVQQSTLAAATFLESFRHNLCATC